MIITSVRLQRECFMPLETTDIQLFFDCDNNYCRVINGSVSKDINADHPELCNILQEIERLHAPLTGLEGIYGCDGETSILTIESGCNEVSFKWWCEPPKGWEGLDRIARMIEQLSSSID